MATEVLSAIGLDTGSLQGDIIGIREEPGADAHFVISCLLSKYIQDDFNICLITFHHTFNHYHNVGMKLGYNLNSLKDQKQIKVIEPMKSLIKNENNCNKMDVLINNVNCNIDELLVNQKRIAIIVDDISHLFDLDFSIRDVLVVLKHFKHLIQDKTCSSLIVNSHVASENDLIIANILQHSSNVQIQVSALKTGASSDISGRMEVLQKNIQNEQNLWNKQNVYHYKLHDRYVKVFAPGLLS